MRSLRNHLIWPLLLLAGCQSTLPPVAVADQVDLQRFMGPWFVIAHIPLPPEKHAFNGVESYHMNKDGSIATTYTFRDGSADGKLKVHHPVAFVSDDPAVWKMQFLWPFKADFRISWLDPDYQVTVIGRKKRDYVWVMARQPHIPAQTWSRIQEFLKTQGYDLSRLRKVPQQWQGTPGYESDEGES